MSGEVEKCPILHVRPKFDVFTLVDIAKKNWNYTSLCFEKGKIYFWRGNFRRGGAVMAFIPDLVFLKFLILSTAFIITS